MSKRLAVIKRLARGAGMRLVRASLLLALLALTVGGAGFWWLHRNILSQLPADLSELKDYRPPTTCRVYAANGTEIDQFYLERRIWVPFGDLPDVAWQAFIAAEDRRFFAHPGVDLLGIVRALMANFHAGGTKQGGSTLTQQLVKNLLVGQERSYRRKMKEAVLAYRLERELTKEQILELYLNYVYLGSGNYGVEAAARDYFGVSARQLNPGQAALLAGLVPAPSRFSPRAHPSNAQARRKLVLRSMAEEGFIDRLAVKRYSEEPVLEPREARPERELASAYATHVRREIRRLLGPQLPFKEGLQIRTPLDLGVQKVAQDAVREGLVALEEREGRRGALQRLPPTDWEGFLRRAPGLDHSVSTGKSLPPDAGQCFHALVGADRNLGALRAGPWRFELRKPDRETRVKNIETDGKPGPLAQLVRAGDLLPVCLSSTSGEKDVVGLDPRPWGEGAAVVIENATGRVVAMVGGYSVGIEGFVRATQARRQPGSSFKPYVYATALLKGHTQLDTVLDAPLALAGGNGKVWSPKNYSGKYMGALPMRNALAQSLNTVSVRLAMQVGPDEIARVAQSMGVKSPLRADLTLALGSSEVTPLDQALGYSTIARMGVPTDAVFIDSLQDAIGAEVGRAAGPVTVNGQTVAVLPGGPGPRALPPEVAYQIADMLHEVVHSGTARRAYKPGWDRAGKTGTTNDCVDAWFVGFTPRYTVATWVGTDGTSSLGEKETGGKAALPIWVKIVEALPQPEGERLPVPDEVTLVQFNEQWVGLPRGHVPATALTTTSASPAPLGSFPVR